MAESYGASQASSAASDTAPVPSVIECGVPQPVTLDPGVGGQSKLVSPNDASTPSTLHASPLRAPPLHVPATQVGQGRAYAAPVWMRRRMFTESSPAPVPGSRAPLISDAVG